MVSMLQPVCLDRTPMGNPSEVAFMLGFTPSKKVLESLVTTDCTVVPVVRDRHRRAWRGDAHDTPDQERGGVGGPGAGGAVDHTARGAGDRNLTSHPAGVRRAARPDRGRGIHPGLPRASPGRDSSGPDE